MYRPRAYFVTSGAGISRVSPLNAFDRALRAARISHLNLVKVTSIIPRGAEEVDYVELEAGTIAFAVLASEVGEGGDTISAGIAWARGEPYGYVMEAHGKERGSEIERRLVEMMRDLEEASNLLLEPVRVKVESLRVPEGCFGAVVAALVFV